MKSIKPIHFVVVGIVFLVCQTGNAQLKVWDGPAIGSWEDAVNWSPNGVPEVFNSVEIGTATGTEGSRISLQTPEFIDSLQITNGSHLAVNPLSGSLAVVGATLVGGAYDGFRSELNLYPSNLVRLHTEYLTIQADGLVNNHNGADINIANLLWVQEGGELRCCCSSIS